MTTRAALRQLIGIIAIALCTTTSGNAQSTIATPQRTYKILHIMSYHSPWRWTDGQFEGFKEAMGGLPVEYKTFQMDTKQYSSTAAKERKGLEARTLIEEWQPDLVYTTDDDAQAYVAKNYIGKTIPFVFSGVNQDPQLYGFEGSPNITGILEQEHFVESLNLLKAIVPSVRRIVAVFDDAPMWLPVRQRMQEKIDQVPNVEIVTWDTIRTFEEYKRKIKEYPGQADAIALIGIFNFKDAQGRDVPYQEVLKWTAENSTLPDFSFWIDRVHYGTLCAVTVSEREQGLAAGQIALAILVDGKEPSAFPMKPTVKGIPAISLARAKKLGIPIKSTLLLSAMVVSAFEWEK